MAKIICVGDIHIRDKNPVHAAESYTEDILEILHWVAKYASEIQADAVVWAGDVFDFKQPSRTSHALVLRMIEVIEAHEVEIWAVVGNHDTSNDRLESIAEKQPLGVLYKAGLKNLVGWHPTLPLFGVPWQMHWTTHEDTPFEALTEWREKAKNGADAGNSLVVTHAPIYPPGEAEKQLFELVPTKGEKGLSAAMGNAGSLYYGHIHEDHGIFEVEGVTYANVGAISRGSTAEYNRTRQIKIAVWEDGVFTEVVVPQKPVEEVLKIDEADQAKAEKLSLDEFLSDVGQSTLDITNTHSVIQHIQGRDDISDRVKKTAIEILEEVE